MKPLYTGDYYPDVDRFDHEPVSWWVILLRGIGLAVFTYLLALLFGLL